MAVEVSVAVVVEVPVGVPVAVEVLVSVVVAVDVPAVSVASASRTTDSPSWVSRLPASPIGTSLLVLRSMLMSMMETSLALTSPPSASFVPASPFTPPSMSTGPESFFVLSLEQLASRSSIVIAVAPLWARPAYST